MCSGFCGGASASSHPFLYIENYYQSNCAFVSCDKLQNIKIPDSVTAIGYNAFYNCDALISVIIPDSVTLIGDSAFKSCANL